MMPLVFVAVVMMPLVAEIAPVVVVKFTTPPAKRVRAPALSRVEMLLFTTATVVVPGSTSIAVTVWVLAVLAAVLPLMVIVPPPATNVLLVPPVLRVPEAPEVALPICKAPPITP